MATTIARLSAVLTTDNSEFNQGFDRAGVVVRRFQNRSEASGGSLAGLAKELAHTQHGAEKASGSLLKMAAFGLGGGIFGLTALAVTLGHKWIEAADKVDEARKRIIEDIEEMRKESQAGPAQIPSELRQESALQELRRETKANIKDIKEFWGISSGPEAKSSVERLEELKKQTKEWLAEQQKLRTEEAKASAERAREFERLKGSADSIAKAFRTPAEVWRDSIAEITRLTSLGLLNMEQYRRAVQKANEDLDNANKNASKIRNSSIPTTGTPALSRFSPEAFSAIQAASRETAKAAEIARQQLEVEKAQQEELEDISRAIQKAPTVRFKTGRLVG